MPGLNLTVSRFLCRCLMAGVVSAPLFCQEVVRGDSLVDMEKARTGQPSSGATYGDETRGLFSDGDSGVVTAHSLVSRATSLRPVLSSGREAVFTQSPLSGIRLVSQETSAAPPPGVETPMPAMAQQPVFQNAGGGAYSGASSTQGTWALVAPYGWISGIDGSLASPLGVLNVNFSPADVFEKLGDVNGAFMLHTEVGRGDYGLILDANIIRLTPQFQAGPALVELDMKQTLMEFLGMARLIESPDFMVEGKSLTVDLLAGGRYYQFTNGLTVLQPIPLPEVERTATWVDMVIGARTRVPLTESLDGFFRVDFGGFGVGSSSNLAWNLITGVDYKCSENTTIAAGYRHLSIDRMSGSGLTASGFDLTLYGPFAAMTLRF